MKTFLAIPCMDWIHTAFFQSILGLQIDGNVRYGTSCSSLVYDARNMLAQRAVDDGYDRIMWLDSDMTFQPDIYRRLSADLDEGMEFVSGLYFKRKNPIEPVIYKETGYTSDDGVKLTPFAKVYADYPKDSVFEIAGSGFGAVMITVDLVRRMYDQYGAPFVPIPGFGEDLSFCRRCEMMGVKMYCDSRIKLGHIAQTIVTEEEYMRGALL